MIHRHVATAPVQTKMITSIFGLPSSPVCTYMCTISTTNTHATHVIYTYIYDIVFTNICTCVPSHTMHTIY